MLNLNITVLVRQTLPKASVVHKPAPVPVEKEKEVAPKPVANPNANRRWSYGEITCQRLEIKDDIKLISFFLCFFQVCNMVKKNVPSNVQLS